MRIENLDWENHLIFVPDSKTPEGRRLIPMSRRVFEILSERCGTRQEGWVFPSTRSASGHIRSIEFIEIKIMGETAVEYGWHELTLTLKAGGKPVYVRTRYLDL